MIEVKVRKNEPIDIAIKRLRGKVEREQLMDTLKSKRGYENPAQKKKRKARRKPLNINWSFAPVTTNNPVK